MVDHAHTYVPEFVEGLIAQRAAWYLSVCDLDQPEGAQFQGAFITIEADLRAASDFAWRATGSKDHIQIVAFPYPKQDLDQISNSDRDRLLSQADLARIGENTTSAGERGFW